MKAMVKRGPHVAAFDRRCSRRCFHRRGGGGGAGGRAGRGGCSRASYD